MYTEIEETRFEVVGHASNKGMDPATKVFRIWLGGRTTKTLGM